MGEDNAWFTMPNRTMSPSIPDELERMTPSKIDERTRDKKHLYRRLKGSFYEKKGDSCTGHVQSEAA
jgi:hypothetical protein